MMPLAFRYKAVTTFDTFHVVSVNVFKLHSIPRRHGEIVVGEEELGEGKLRTHFHGAYLSEDTSQLLC
jgi:hypothetical protein